MSMRKRWCWRRRSLAQPAARDEAHSEEVPRLTSVTRVLLRVKYRCRHDRSRRRDEAHPAWKNLSPDDQALLEELHDARHAFKKGGLLRDGGRQGAILWIQAVTIYFWRRFGVHFAECDLNEPGVYTAQVLSDVTATGAVAPMLRSRRNPGKSHGSEAMSFKASCLVLSELLQEQTPQKPTPEIDLLVWQRVKDVAGVFGIKQERSGKNIVNSWRTALARERPDPKRGRTGHKLPSLEGNVVAVKIGLHPWFKEQIFPVPNRNERRARIPAELERVFANRGVEARWVRFCEGREGYEGCDPEKERWVVVSRGVPKKPDPGPLIDKLWEKVSIKSLSHLSQASRTAT
jgi:hypothetical protein